MDTSHITTAEEARQYAIDWQSRMQDRNPSYGELAEETAELEKLAQRLNLTEEWRENGVI